MKKLSIIVLIIYAAIFLAGCPKNAPDLNLKDENYRNQLVALLKDEVFLTQWIEYKCANDGYYHLGINSNSQTLNSKKGGRGIPNNTGFTSFNCGFSNSNAGFKQSARTAEKVRNEVLDNGVGLIDSAYGVYIRNIRKKRSVGEFIADLLQVGGSTASGIVKGERPLQIIGVALTGFSAGRKSASLNFYDEKTTSILIKRMDASRSLILGEIKQLQRKSTDEYSFDAALGDIVRYFDAGTLNRAFTELDKQTSIQADIAAQGVLKIKDLKSISEVISEDRAEKIAVFYEDLETLEEHLENKDKKDVAAARLKTIYQMITGEAKFNEVTKSLKEKATVAGKDPDELYAPRLKAIYGKLDKNEALTGREYLELIDAVKGDIETSPKRDELLKLLQEFIDKTK